MSGIYYKIIYIALANIFIPKFQRRKIIPVNINFFSDNLFFLLDRSSQRMYSVKKDVFRNLQNSQENTCARVSFLKKRLWHKCFPVNFAKFLRTCFFTEHLWVTASD